MTDPDQRKRLEELEGRIEKLKTKEQPKAHQEEHYSQAQQAWRMVIELVTGLMIGFGIGYGLDSLFGTIPIFLVLFTFLGFAAGVQTMMRSAAEMQKQTWPKRPRTTQRPMRATRRGRKMATEAQGEEGGLVFHPMDQFIVKPLFGDGPVGLFTITNVTLWMALTVVAVVLLMVLGTSKRSTIPGRMQSVGELAYGFIYKMVEDVAGKDAVAFSPTS